MIDFDIIRQLVRDLSSDEHRQQVSALRHVRDLCLEREQYRQAFVQAGAVAPLVALLGNSGCAHTAVQCLTVLGSEQPWREEIREAGGVDRLVGLLGPSESSEAVQEAALHALQQLASDSLARMAIHDAGGVQFLLKMVTMHKSQRVQILAARLIASTAELDTVRTAVRVAGGIQAILKLLRDKQTAVSLVEALSQALARLCLGNEVNQDAVREQFGIPGLVALLEGPPEAAAAAALALRAICTGNDANKVAVREAWGIPLIVKLMGPEVDMAVAERAVDCLRVLTAGNEANQAAFLSISSSISSLVRLMRRYPHDPVAERAAAVVGNLSSDERYFAAIRESGALSQLVRLLDAGPQARGTEIAVKTLANMANNDFNRKGIRLGGGIPPLLKLLIDSPSPVILGAVEDALSKLQVSWLERNAMLEAFRYADQRHAALTAAATGPPTLSPAVSMPATAADRRAASALALQARGIPDRLERELQDASGIMQRGLAEAGPPGRSRAEAAAMGAAGVGATGGVAAGDDAAAANAAKPLTKYTPGEVARLLQAVGLRDASAFEANGITGGDLLDLEDGELRTDLGLNNIQVRKVKSVRAAFELFNTVLQYPGKGVLTRAELEDYLLMRQGLSDSDASCVLAGFPASVVTFHTFALSFPWFTKTLAALSHSGPLPRTYTTTTSATTPQSTAPPSPTPSQGPKAAAAPPQAPPEKLPAAPAAAAGVSPDMSRQVLGGYGSLGMPVSAPKGVEFAAAAAGHADGSPSQQGSMLSQQAGQAGFEEYSGAPPAPVAIRSGDYPNGSSAAAETLASPKAEGAGATAASSPAFSQATRGGSSLAVAPGSGDLHSEELEASFEDEQPVEGHTEEGNDGDDALGGESYRPYGSSPGDELGVGVGAAGEREAESADDEAADAVEREQDEEEEGSEDEAAEEETGEYESEDDAFSAKTTFNKV